MQQTKENEKLRELVKQGIRLRYFSSKMGVHDRTLSRFLDSENYKLKQKNIERLRELLNKFS